MTTDALPPTGTPFGDRVRRRLRDEVFVWMTTVGADGTPQPNPVWFVWDDGDVLIYNQHDARRLAHLRTNAHVSLHFNANARGGDVVVLSGRAELADGEPPHEMPAYLDKYRDQMIRVSGSLEAFSARYSIPVRVRIDRLRGF
ncbi:MAG TPA: TIGR03667 family PPOX class F420-dependent oxidoreductase [Jatrophihabitantaceae bacterium]